MENYPHHVGPVTAHKLPAGSKVAPVADDEQTTTKTPTAPPKAVKSATAFVAKHGKGSRAVVEPLGRAGARVVLVGADGAMGDLVLPDVPTAEALVEHITDLDAAEWDRETTASLKIGPAHRRKMAGR